MMRILAAALAILTAGCAPAPRPSATPTPLAPYDLVIAGGRIVDGTGSAWFYGDVAVTGDRIARIAPGGMLADAPAHTRIDARGMVVAPGFIDIQSHSRAAFLRGDGRIISKITQGITTEILGEGWTDAPANERTVAGTGDLADPESERVARQAFFGPRGFDRWLRTIEERGVSANVGSFVGGATVRAYAKGRSAGAPTPAELDTMRAVMVRAMEDGAFGLATALIYPPGNFATTAELIGIARAMAPYGGVYITHMRSEADQVLEATDEAIRIGREGGVPVEIYHLKVAGQRNWPKTAELIERIEAARRAGLDVQANMYPYVAGGTGLSACLPPWADEDGRLLENLRDPVMRARIRAEVLDQQTEWENLCELATPDGVLLLGLQRPDHEALVGKRLSDVAALRDQGWVDAVIDLLLAEEQRIGTIFFLMSEENVAEKMRQPWMKFGTDAGGQDPARARGPTHPRAYGTFPRILGKYVREEGVLGLEEAVRKMTSAVATRLSVADRGLLREGMYADLVVFDPDRVRDRATFEEPHQLSVGIRDVVVNGTPVLRDGEHTGATPGRVVRGPGYRLPTAAGWP
jgi:N-acyl-D-amino-acid deacylase